MSTVASTAPRRAWSFRQPSVIPGFGLTLGFTLTYFSLIILIPLIALAVRSAGLGPEGFWKAATDARVLGATIKAGESLEYAIGANRHAYMVPATGAVEIDGQRANARDGVAIGEGAITITAIEDAEIVLVDSR